MRHWCIMLTLTLACQGCDQLSTEYGESRGLKGSVSLNGFGAYRSAYENAGYRTRNITRLSNRVKSTDVIVWTPKVLHPIQLNVTDWMESWLSDGGRTLVFILPDSGSEVNYWANSSAAASPDQQREYRRREVRGTNQQMKWRLNRRDWSGNGWYEASPLQQRLELKNLTGPWVDENHNPQSDPQARERADGSFTLNKQVPALPPHSNSWIEYEIRETGRGARTANKPAYTAPANAEESVETGPGSLTAEGMPWFYDWDVEASTTEVKVEPLVQTSNKKSVVVRLSSAAWSDSQVFVVAGGSLLTNYAFSQPWNRQLADRIILSPSFDATGKPVAGFLTSGWSPIIVAEGGASAPTKTGMEMLTEWPMSLITMHGVFLGGIICLMMIPILGRPRKVQRETPTDFTLHLDAIGALMKKAKGDAHARRRLGEYYRMVHGNSRRLEERNDLESSDDGMKVGSGAEAVVEELQNKPSLHESQPDPDASSRSDHSNTKVVVDPIGDAGIENQLNEGAKDRRVGDQESL